MSARPRLLFIEDDRRLASLTCEYLERHSCTVTHVTRGEAGLRAALRGPFDLLLLDVMLPDMSGIEVCRKLRDHSDIPIIMLTARGEEADRVLGLETGADDYVPKPFSPRELMARITALLRRAKGRLAKDRRVVRAGDLVLDPGALKATLSDSPVDLTSYEFQLLLALAERPGKVLSRERLLEAVRGDSDEVFDRSVDVHISRLRQKLGDDPHSPRIIRTIRGAGYQYIGGGDS